MHIKTAALCAACAVAASALAADRPELTAFPSKTAVTAAGSYSTDSVGTDFVLSGTIEGDVEITASKPCRVTLSGATLTGSLTLGGKVDCQLWLSGDSTITSSSETAVVATNTATLTVGGPGTLAATATAGKKIGVVCAKDFVLAGGKTSLTMTKDVKNACGVYVAGNYTQLAGSLSVTATGSKKQNGIFLATKKMAAAISGGMLGISLAGEKAVGLAMDKGSIDGSMTGGVLKFAMSGNGSKGVKGDGTFSMSGGTIDATMSGGYAEDLLEYEYEDADGNETVYNFYVTLTSSTKTSGGTSSYNTSSMINSGTYAVYDPSKSYAVKVGTLDISGGLVRVRATGTCGRGLGADNMYLSGGVFDIEVTGGPTDVYVESLVNADDIDETNWDSITTCLDSGGAACLKTSGTNGVMSITGGTFELKATGNAGKLINAGGYLVIGASGASTLPTDSSFSPDIQGQALGSKVYCTYYKQKYYGSLATATRTDEDTLASMTLSTTSANIVSGSGDDVDYSNPKGAKAESGVTVNGGRIRIYTANDGGEGLESKSAMDINGGVIELNCADDCINTAGNLTINGGCIYAASTGNDAIDSNANVTINGGWIYAFTLSNPEEAFDVNSGYSVTINGGCVFGVGAAQSCREGTLAGTQGYYQGTKTLSTSATYWKATGTNTIYGKIPAAASSSSAYMFVSVPGMTSGTAPTSYGTSAPSANSVGFHGFYTTGDVSGN